MSAGSTYPTQLAGQPQATIRAYTDYPEPYEVTYLPNDQEGYAAQPFVIRAPPRKGRSSMLTWAVVLAILLACSLCFLAGLPVGVYTYYQVTGRIVSGVTVGQVALGGMTREEADIALRQEWLLNTKILATNGMQSQELTPSDLGITVNFTRTLQEAHDVSRGGLIPVEISQTITSLKDGWPITPVASLDEGVARVRLEALAATMGQPAVDATLRVDGATLTPVPSALGYTINIEATLASLKSNLDQVLSQKKLQVIPQPVLPRVTEATPALVEAQRLLDTPLTIHAYDPVTDEDLSWPLPRETLAGWLTVTAGEAGPRVALDPTGVAAYLTSLSQGLGAERYLQVEKYSAPLAEALSQGQSYSVLVSHYPTSYVVQPGDTMLKISWRVGVPYWMILNANPGMDPEKITSGATLTIPSKDDLLPLPPSPGKRIIIYLARQRLEVFQDKNRLRQFVISTGIDRSPTQPGVFQVQTHIDNAYASVWDLYMPNFLGIYESWPGFMNGIHGLPTLSNGQRLWANILGSPASYGCIILDLPAASWLYNWAEDGVVVEIRP
jgi:lipoprotein-anchoring transpeptidase ErfK/SrfK